MLGDDVIDGGHKGVHIVGNALKNTVKGALLFGAIGAGAALAVTAVVGLASGGAVLGTLAAVIETAPVLSWAAIGAAAGGAVAGLASFLPGNDEGFSLKRLFKRDPHKARQPEQQHVQEYSRQQTAPAQHRREDHRDRGDYRANDRREPVPANYSHNEMNAAGGDRGYCPPQPNHIIIDNSQRYQHVRSDAPSLTQNFSASEANSTALTVNPQAPASKGGDNPYYRAGKGAEMMRKGDERQNDPSLAK